MNTNYIKSKNLKKKKRRKEVKGKLKENVKMSPLRRSKDSGKEFLCSTAVKPKMKNNAEEEREGLITKSYSETSGCREPPIEDESHTPLVETIDSDTDVGSDSPCAVESNKLNKDNRMGTEWFFPLHYISNNNTHLKHLQLLKKRGIVPRTGKWTTEEVEQLHENMMRFLSCHNIKDFRRLIVPQTKEDLLFRKETDFVLNMCHGIRRTRAVIRNKIEQQYTNFLTKGRMTENEKETLIKLQRIYGNRWQKIGFLMNRYHRCMSINYQYATGVWNKGAWSGEEDNLLKSAVKPYLERNESIPWTQVSKIVGTRSKATCAVRWLSQLSKRIDITNTEITLSDEDAYKLVSYIYNLNIDDDYLIDWTEVASYFNHKYKPGWLRCKFQALSKEVPSSHLLEFVDVVEKLYEIFQQKKKNGEKMNTEQIDSADDYTNSYGISESKDSAVDTKSDDVDIVVID